MDLIVFYSREKDILRIVSHYKKIYKADVYEIKTLNKINFFIKLTNSKVLIEKCNINIKQYNNIIIITPLWFNNVPSPVIRFLEQSAGRINNITYILYNFNKEDKPKEFDKMDKILNLNRNKSYFINLNKKEINVRTYQ